MLDYLKKQHVSRGAALYACPDGDFSLDLLPDSFSYSLDDGRTGGLIQEIRYQEDGSCFATWRSIRPLPQKETVFEVMWAEYRKSRKAV